ncbi:hypothetical protein [Hymenobacter negativus]|uniref:DUF4760 domain-containing protein n=1 Tax=Hymenobacter negativus TaxID=2795026 RepID=A0ABS0QB21_9BACT|nr:hypothetical protein [Hymenobacter negativus]MBH8559858.1 hypothetical protein [Hymenobacter negativus]
MKRLLTLLLTLAALAGHAQPAPPAQQTVPPRPAVAPKAAPASAVVKSQPNQPIYLTLASEAKPQQSTGTNYTLFAAIIAALASLTSAYIALKSKDKDFKNDYYKKMIDKRLSAYDDIESILNNLSHVVNVEKLVNKKPESVGAIFKFFESDESFHAFMNKLQSVIHKGFWLSTGCKNEIIDFYNKLSEIGKELKVYENQNFNRDELINAGLKYYNSIDKVRIRVYLLMVEEIIEIQNVEKFFKGLYPDVKKLTALKKRAGLIE